MPRLGEEKLERLVMPSSTPGDEAYVVIDFGFGADAILDAEARDGSSMSMAMMTKMIREWNYQDESGSVAPITVENIRRMPGMDYTYINKLYMDRIDRATSSQVSDTEKKT